MKTKLDEFVDWFVKEYQNETIDIIENNPEKISKMLYDALKLTVLSKIKPREINNINDLSRLLNGNENGNELDNPYNINVEELCKKNKWIILFPYSDDCLEIRGYIDDEIGAWDDTNYKIIKKGDFYPDEDEDNTYHKAEQNMICSTEDKDADIFMKWCSKDHSYTWFIEINCMGSNVAYFDVVDEDDEDNQTWARCCIIDCSNIL